MSELSFVRWQKIALDQMGYAVNLILVLSVASLGFAFSALRDLSFEVVGHRACLFGLSLLLLAISIMIGIACVILRLVDFRKTKDIARDREQLFSDGKTKPDVDRLPECRRQLVRCLDRWVWRTFYGQIGTFLVGEVLLGVALLIVYRDSR